MPYPYFRICSGITNVPHVYVSIASNLFFAKFYYLQNCCHPRPPCEMLVHVWHVMEDGVDFQSCSKFFLNLVSSPKKKVFFFVKKTDFKNQHFDLPSTNNLKLQGGCRCFGKIQNMFFRFAFFLSNAPVLGWLRHF